MLPLVYYAIPGFVALLLLEWAWLRRTSDGASTVGPPTVSTTIPSTGAPVRGYLAPDARASLVMGLGNVAVNGLMKVPTFALFGLLYEYRLFEIGTGAAAWLLLFVAEDLTYYGWHRASHEIRFMWSAHESHHSSRYFNLSTALRQSWTTPFTTPLFYFWLPLAGFHPAMLATQISISLIYQFWIHTELIDRLPRPFEAILNTPSHHRVHHGANVEYLDRNHGGILIVWDRLFGSFAAERAPVVYGLTRNIDTYSPIRIALHDWADLIRAVLRPAPLATRLAHVFAPPGWSPDGSTQTAAELRAARTASPSGTTASAGMAN
ncbi:MAG: sterol desaturase family protein [Myxococcota bacterium]